MLNLGRRAEAEIAAIRSSCSEDLDDNSWVADLSVVHNENINDRLHFRRVDQRQLANTSRFPSLWIAMSARLFGQSDRLATVSPEEPYQSRKRVHQMVA